jgi:hypothetical protein
VITELKSQKVNLKSEDRISTFYSLLSGEYYFIIILEKYNPRVIESRRDEIMVEIH